jgi:hypothetical protein
VSVNCRGEGFRKSRMFGGGRKRSSRKRRRRRKLSGEEEEEEEEEERVSVLDREEGTRKEEGLLQGCQMMETVEVKARLGRRWKARRGLELAAAWS